MGDDGAPEDNGGEQRQWSFLIGSFCLCHRDCRAMRSQVISILNQSPKLGL